MKEVFPINYSDAFFYCSFDDEAAFGHKIIEHRLTYVFSGELALEYQGKKKYIRENQCVFIRRDFPTRVQKKSYKGQSFKGISMLLKRNILRDFYNNLDKKTLPIAVKGFKSSIVNIEALPQIESLFTSFIPYFTKNIEPSAQIISLKMQEAIMVLLQTDERFYPTLFDFNESWKMDILEFMNQNYMHELSINEIAQHTGRSLATFKRDFAKISELTPQKWLTKKRLEVAYDRLQQGEKPSYLYSELGFKSLSHFYQAFKNEYGFSIKDIS